MMSSSKPRPVLWPTFRVPYVCIEIGAWVLVIALSYVGQTLYPPNNGKQQPPMVAEQRQE